MIAVLSSILSVMSKKVIKIGYALHININLRLGLLVLILVLTVLCCLMLKVWSETGGKPRICRILGLEETEGSCRPDLSIRPWEVGEE